MKHRDNSQGIAKIVFGGSSSRYEIGVFPAFVLTTSIFSCCYGIAVFAICSSLEIAGISPIGALFLGGVIGIVHFFLLRWFDALFLCQENFDHVLLNWPVSGLAGGISGGLGGFILGAWLGASDPASHRFHDIAIERMGSGNAVSAAILLSITGFIIGACFGGLESGLMYFLLPVEERIQRKIVPIILPLMARAKYQKILCHACLRFSRPDKAHYQNGARFCEHCQARIPRTANEPGKIAVSFGDIRIKRRHRCYLLENADFGGRDAPIEVSVVYIDTRTSDKYLIERFLAYILNYPPTGGQRSIQIRYRGELHELGENLKNVLQNNFSCIRQIQEKGEIQ